MVHRNWGGCIVNFNALLQLQLFVSTPRHLDGNLFSNDSRSYLFPSPRNVKNRKCWIGIRGHLHLLKHRLICFTLSGWKSERPNRLLQLEFHLNLRLLLSNHDLHSLHPLLPKQNFIDNPIFKHRIRSLILNFHIHRTELPTPGRRGVSTIPGGDTKPS